MIKSPSTLQKIFDCYQAFRKMLNIEQEDEECDATKTIVAMSLVTK
jgi:hypothetical protein